MHIESYSGESECIERTEPVNRQQNWNMKQEPLEKFYGCFDTVFW